MAFTITDAKVLAAEVTIFTKATAPLNDIERLKALCEKLAEGMGPDDTFQVREVRWA